MNEKYAAIIIGVAMFVLSLCFFAPVLQRTQEQEDAVKKLRKREKKKRRALGTVYTELRQRQKNSLVNRSIVRRANAVSYTRKSDAKSAKLLSSANIRMDVGVYSALRLGVGAFLALINLVIGSSLVNNRLHIYAMCITGLCTGILIPQMLLTRRAKKRKEALLNSMPDTMDLLSITTNAGLGFEAAVMRIAEGSSSPCIQELRMVVSDIQHGISKKNAYLSMKERCDLREMSAFVTAIIQSEELGTSVSATLTEQAEVLRQNRRIRADENANKAPVKITIPLVFCIFPALLIVLIGPAFYKIMGAF